ncbi:GvpL/GvpF family gas vesicle protein [Streptomyces antnestii]|uniref:GvpL/GvpF family gas vesicle protein n=1 Tax=Streptomyces antnestii TaxID=2494256 RepID=A0A3S2YR65_9ACTN|nr:GvpL/GvpF family gas vesicle protein [Streptomyces sp. San01]RVU17571.1 GvpL/GvpF family gas vesicle protein [Streptomyces sp. San01]
MAVYIYSITSKQHPLPLAGLEGVGDPPAQLQTVTGGPLCAVISDAPDDLRPKRRDLSAHHQVQEHLMEGGSVLPMRFGFLAPDVEAVRLALEERAQEYTARLEALEDSVEYNLKVSQDQDVLLREILESSQEARQLNDEIRGGSASPGASVRLGEIVAAEVQAREQALAHGIIEALRPYSRDRESAQPTGEDFLNASFLVPHEHEEMFLATELSVANQLGEDVHFRLNGPLPPYSFV